MMELGTLEKSLGFIGQGTGVGRTRGYWGEGRRVTRNRPGEVEQQEKWNSKRDEPRSSRKTHRPKTE